MIVYRLEFIEDGEYYVLTEKELQTEYTNEQIKDFKTNDMIIFYETKFTTRQLSKAKKLKSDEEYCYNFEDEYGIAPSLYDILEVL